MKFTKFAVGATLALTVAAFSPAAFAQTGGDYGQNGNYSNGYSNNSSRNNEGADFNNGTTANGENPWRVARDVREQIRDARENVQNVGLSYHNYVIGMNDLQNGNRTAAMARFRLAEDVLNNEGANEGSNNESNGESKGGNASWSNGNGNSTVGLRQRCDQLKNQIDQARDEGLDVSSADHQYFLGMRDMRNGDDNQAMRHFDLAEKNLDSEGYKGASNASWSGGNGANGASDQGWSGNRNGMNNQNGFTGGARNAAYNGNDTGNGGGDTGGAGNAAYNGNDTGNGNGADNMNPDYNTRTNNTTDYNNSNTSDYSKTSRATNLTANDENGAGNENGNGYQNDSANTSWSNMDPEQVRKELKNSIFTAREQGVDVIDSNHEYRLGVRALDQGNNQAAMRYFEEARNELRQEENGNSNQGNMAGNDNNGGNGSNWSGRNGNTSANK
jgi:hypothetical protein